ncbi:unnamed protein product, partial [Laminaria digitata]
QDWLGARRCDRCLLLSYTSPTHGERSQPSILHLPSTLYLVQYYRNPQVYHPASRIGWVLGGASAACCYHTHHRRMVNEASLPSYTFHLLCTWYSITAIHRSIVSSTVLTAVGYKAVNPTHYESNNNTPMM